MVSDVCLPDDGPNMVYGSLKFATATGDDIYPDFCAVSWVSNAGGVSGWLDTACKNADSLKDAICEELPKSVGLGPGDVNQVITLDFNKLPEWFLLVQPTWDALHIKSVVPHTYEYVFDKFKGFFQDTDDWEDFQANCTPPKAVFDEIQSYGPGDGQKGLDAFNKLRHRPEWKTQFDAVNLESF